LDEGAVENLLGGALSVDHLEVVYASYAVSVGEYDGAVRWQLNAVTQNYEISHLTLNTFRFSRILIVRTTVADILLSLIALVQLQIVVSYTLQATSIAGCIQTARRQRHTDIC